MSDISSPFEKLAMRSAIYGTALGFLSVAFSAMRDNVLSIRPELLPALSRPARGNHLCRPWPLTMNVIQAGLFCQFGTQTLGQAIEFGSRSKMPEWFAMLFIIAGSALWISALLGVENLSWRIVWKVLTVQLEEVVPRARDFAERN